MDVYSSPRRRASSWARSITRFARGSSDSWPPCTGRAGRGSPASSSRNAGRSDAEPAERLGGDPVIGLDERGEQVLGVEHGALQPLGELLGGDDGLLGLLGESVELHGRVSCGRSGRWWCGSGGRPGVGLVDEVEERLRRAALPRRAAVGSTTRTFTYRSPAPSSFIRGMPWPVSRNVRPPWVPAGIVSRIRPLSVVDRHLGPQQRLAQRDRELALEVRAPARVDRVRARP